MNGLAPSALAMIVVALSACSTTQPPAPPNPPSANLEEHRRIAEAAKQAYSLLITERDQGQEPLTPDFIERLHRWALRLARAQYAMADTRMAKVAVVRNYLEEMKQLHNVTIRTFHIGGRLTPFAAFYVAEAELWLAKVMHDQ